MLFVVYSAFSKRFLIFFQNLWNMVKNSEKKQLIDILQSHNVCSRCILRFLRVRTYSCYTLKEDVKKEIAKYDILEDIDSLTEEINDEAPPSKRHHASICPICLGILQDECEKMAETIHDSVIKSQYEFDDFVLQLSVPVAIDLRQCLMIFHIQEQLGEEFKLKEGDVPSVKEVWKWVVGMRLGKLLNVDFATNSDFQISISIMYAHLTNECSQLLEACPEAFPNSRKSKAHFHKIYNRTSVMKAIELLDSKLKSLYDLPLNSPEKPCSYKDIICNHSPLYLAGRYNKYSRELSQTPWLVDGERRMESSVQELITDIVQKRISCDSIIFSASGREDVDVKMLGNGRPFVLEISNPKKVKFSLEEMKNIENEINVNTDLVAVSLLQVISKNDLKILKEGEELKRKTYSALCLVKKKLTEEDLKILEDVKDLTLKQKTPIRVLHRRPLATRDKIVHRITGKILDEHSLEVEVETQAGTYVKEFIHSDFGRTHPSLGTLLQTEADILELNVESIHIDWPPNPAELVNNQSDVNKT